MKKEEVKRNRWEENGSRREKIGMRKSSMMNNLVVEPNIDN